MLNPFLKAACLALVVLAGAGAQTPQPGLVNLNVAATDEHAGHGAPVTDLTAADFEISDNGKPQTIAYFVHPPAPGPTKPDLRQHEYSNRLAGSASHATVLLFDMFNSNVAEQGFVRNAIIHALESRESSDYLYFYILSRDAKLFPVHPLPDTAAQFQPEQTPWTRQIKPLIDDAMKTVNRLRLAGIVDDDRVKMTYEALNRVVATMAMIPGRKNIVWISRGVPIRLRLVGGPDEINYTPLARKFADQCDQAKLSFYTVYQSSSGTPPPAELVNVETLQTLANLSGGRTYATNDDTVAAVGQAVDQWRASYTIAYRPDADNWDGKPHKIRVTTSRRGTTLLFRQSYDAVAPGTERLRAALQSAVSSPLDSPEIGLQVLVTKGSKPGTVQLGILANSADVFQTQQGDNFAAQLTALFVDYTAQGPKAISKPIGFDVKMTKEQHDAAIKNGIRVDQERPVGEGIEKIKVIVYDAGLNNVGSLTVPVKVE